MRCEGIYPGWDGAAGGASVLLLLAEDVGARGEVRKMLGRLQRIHDCILNSAGTKDAPCLSDCSRSRWWCASAVARSRWGSVALSLGANAHPTYTGFANIFGASVSEATMRPKP